jgi:adenylate cyclase
MEPTLAAILVADIVGYARLMEAHEFETHRRLMALRNVIIDPVLAASRGRIIKQTGDGFIAIFSGVNDAVNGAIQIQHAALESEADIPAEEKIRFRMGLNVGDVVEEAGDIFGFGVNVAARLQELAEPGGLLISGSVHEQAGHNLSMPIIDCGLLPLKNIEKPVQAFQVLFSSAEERPRRNRSPLHRQPSIAVLPFRTTHGGQRDAWFGDGIVEDIIGALARLNDFVVISRSSTLTYREQPTEVRRVGTELSVRYVLSGSVRRNVRSLRVSAELAETEQSSVLWAQTFDAGRGDLFRIQDEITYDIVSKIAPRIREAEIQRAFLKRPANMDAYDHSLQALSLLYRLSQKDFAQAGALLRRAIALDDGYATSFALAAEWHGLRVGQGWSPDRQLDSQEVVRLAQAAIDRDSSDVRGLTLLGHYKSYLFHDLEGALALFDRAIATNPGSAWAWGRSAPTYSYIGNGDEAIQRAQHALRLSPFDLLAHRFHTSLCVGHYTRGDYEQAVYWGHCAARENPRYAASLFPTAAALGALRRKVEAAEVTAKILSISPNFSASSYAMSYPYREKRRRQRLQQHLLAAGLPP